jgi:hypothetical protein
LETSLIFSGQELTSRILDVRLVVRGQVGEIIVGRRDLSRYNSSIVHLVSDPSVAAGHCHFDFDPGCQLSYLVISEDCAGHINILVWRKIQNGDIVQFSRVGIGNMSSTCMGLKHSAFSIHNHQSCMITSASTEFD